MFYLQELVKLGPQTVTLHVSERLPAFMVSPSDLEVRYEVKAQEDFFLLELHVKGVLNLECQRCLGEYTHTYENQTVLAICRDETRAEQLLEHYESLVSEKLQVDLKELIIDELHLYAPQYHLEIKECNPEIDPFLA